MVYLKIHHNARNAFDPTYPDIEMDRFQIKDWSSMYGVNKESIPGNIPESLVNELIYKLSLMHLSQVVNRPGDLLQVSLFI